MILLLGKESKSTSRIQFKGRLSVTLSFCIISGKQGCINKVPLKPTALLVIIMKIVRQPMQRTKCDSRIHRIVRSC